MSIIDSYVKEPVRLLNEPFFLSVESIVVAQGRGTVVTGKVERGKLKVGDELELMSNKKSYKTVCMGIEMFRKILEYAQVGDNVGVLLKNVPNKEVKRGNVLTTPNTMKRYISFNAKVYILSKKEGGRSKPFVSGYKPQFFF